MTATKGADGDAAQVQAALEGDAAAFDALVGRHYGMVYQIGYAHLASREAAEDLAQEIFLTVYLHMRRNGPPRQFAAWLRQIARNRAIDWRRREQRTSRLIRTVSIDEVAAGIADQQTEGARKTVEISERNRAVRDAIMELPPDLRELVLLHYIEGMTKKEIGQRTAIHPVTVARRIDKALAAMKEALEPVLRELVPAMKSSRGAAASTSALVAAVSAMSAAKQDAFAEAAAATTELAASSFSQSGGATGIGALFGSLKTLLAATTKAVTAMSIKAKAATALVAASLVTGGVLLSSQSDPKAQGVVPTAKPLSGIPVVLNGRVVNAEGNPIAGATVYVTSNPQFQKTTGDSGRFRFNEAETKRLLAKAEADKPNGGVDIVASAEGFGLDWIEVRGWGTPSEGDLGTSAARNVTLRLVKDDVPIRGQLVTREGRPVPNARIELCEVLALPDNDLSTWLADWETSRHKIWQKLARRAHKRYRPVRLRFPFAFSGRFPHRDLAELSEPAIAGTVTSDSQGRFEIRGVGRGRVVRLWAEHPDFVRQMIFVATRSNFNLAPADETLPPLHPATFGQALEPAKSIRGTVREHGTGKPLAGAIVYAQMYPSKNAGVVNTTTAADGTFHMRGLGQAEAYRFVVVSAKGQPHLRRTIRAPGVPRHAGPIDLNVDLTRGVVVKGRVTNKVTGRPIHRATLSYIPIPDNPNSEAITEAGDEAWDHRFTTDQEGAFAVAIPPGPGLIGVRAWYGGESRFWQLERTDFPYPLEKGETLRTSFGGIVRPEKYQAVVKVNPPENGATEELKIQLNPIEGK